MPRGIGKGSAEFLRHILASPEPWRYELLTDQHILSDPLLSSGGSEWRTLRPSFYPIWEQVRLPMYLHRFAPAIFHAVGNTGPILKPKRTRLVVTVHDLLFFERWPLSSARQRAGRIYRRFVVPRVLVKADRVIAVSEVVADQIVRRFPDTKVKLSVIGTPVSSIFLSVGLPPKRATGSGPAYLVAFGASDARKNLARTVSAFQIVRREYLSAQLILVGTQHNVRELYGNLPGVVCRSFISDAELVNLYRGSKGLVYASLAEGFGVPVLEALAVGTPVITSDRSPLRELAGGMARLVDPENVQEIAGAMLQFLTEAAPIPLELAEARRTTARAYSGQVLTKAVLGVYEMMLACGAEMRD